MSSCIIITIGDELLIGQVLDTNSAWIGTELNKAGIPVLRRIAVGDSAEEIVYALNESLSAAEIVLITGGLGPTKDDITKHTLAKYFNSTLVVNQDVLNDVTLYFARLKRPMLESNYKQAEVPDACKVIRNTVGTAPGMWFEKNGKVVVSMPGVPFEMKEMMQSYVLPELKKRFSKEHIEHFTIMTSGVGESFLAEKIKDWEEDLPENIKLAYLPNLSQVRLRLTGFGADESVVRSQIQEQVAKLLPLIQQHVYALEDTQIEVVIGKELLQRSKTIGTAESCTGGYIAHKITSVPGSSQWFMGSVIAYQNKLKETLLHVNENTLQTHGAVSEETVIEMATHARTVLKSDYAIAVSGIAGPDGGTAEKPTGLVWIAIADAENVYSRKFQFLRSRLQNIEMTANQALFMLYKILKGTYES